MIVLSDRDNIHDDVANLLSIALNSFSASDQQLRHALSRLRRWALLLISIVSSAELGFVLDHYSRPAAASDWSIAYMSLEKGRAVKTIDQPFSLTRA
jgi:hypothetical protein